MNTFNQLQEQLAALEEVDRIWQMKESNLMDRIEGVIQSRGRLNDKIQALQTTIAQPRSSDHPKGWFVRNFSK